MQENSSFRDLGRKRVEEWRLRQERVLAPPTPLLGHVASPQEKRLQAPQEDNQLYWAGLNDKQGGSRVGGDNGKYLLHIFRRQDINAVIAHRVLGVARAGKYNANDHPLFCIPPRSTFRRRLLSLITHRFFDPFILCCIIMNCAIEVLHIPSLSGFVWAREVRAVSEIVFLIIFTIEALLKVCALGFVWGRDTYLRNAWNVVDFAVLLLGYLMVVLDKGGSFSIIRIVRIFRPLRGLSHTSSIHILIEAYVLAVPIIFEVLLLLALIVFMFAILGVQLWNGSMHQRCYAYPLKSESLYLGTMGYDFDAYFARNETRLEGVDVGTQLNPPLLVQNDSTIPCGGGRGCGSGVRGFDLKCEIHVSVIHSYVANFDNIVSSLFQVVRVITLDDWPDEMFDVQDASHTMAWVYFIILTIVGGYFLLYMVTSVLTVAFAEAKHSASRAVQNEVVPQGTMGKAPMATSVYLYSRDPDKKIFQSKLHAIDSAMLEDERGVDKSQTNAELTVEKYFGVHKYLEEYRLDLKKQKQKNLGIERRVQHLNQLREILEDDDEAARGEQVGQIRKIPDSLRVDTLLGLNVFQFLLAVASPLVILPDMTPQLALTESESQSTALGSEAGRTLRMKIRGLVDSKPFLFVMLAITMIAVVALASDYDGISEEHEYTVYVIGLVCFGVFVFEFILKMVALGPKGYVKDKFNILDLAVLLMMVPDLFVKTIGINALRAFRALRLLGFLSSYQKEMLASLGTAVPDLTAVLVLLLLFVFMCSLLGISLFEGTFPEESRESFDSLWEASLLIFIMVAGDGWTPITRTAVQATNPWAAVFFVLVFFFGTVLIMSMVPAVLIDRMTAALRHKRKKISQDALRQLEVMGIARDPNALSSAILERREAEETKQRFLETPRWKLRRWEELGVERGTVLTLLGNWKAEFSLRKRRPYWVNTLTGAKVWDNPTAASPTIPVTNLQVGLELEVWQKGNWHPATVLGIRDNGTATLILHSTQDVQHSVGPSFLRETPHTAGNPLAHSATEKYSPAHELLRSFTLLNAYNHPDMGGFMLLWCALSKRGKERIEQVWADQGGRDALLFALSEDGTLTPMPQPFHDEDQRQDEQAPSSSASEDEDDDDDDDDDGGGGEEPNNINTSPDIQKRNPLASHYFEGDEEERDEVQDASFRAVGSLRHKRRPFKSNVPPDHPNPLDRHFPKKNKKQKKKRSKKVHIVIPATGEVEVINDAKDGLDEDCQGIGGACVAMATETLELVRNPPDQNRAFEATRDDASVYNADHNYAKKAPQLTSMKLRSASHSVIQSYTLDDPSLKIANRSLSLFSRESLLRRALSVIVFHKFFNDFMLVVVGVNAVFLALDDYYVENRPGGRALLDAANIVFVVIYVLEILMKIVVLGLYRAQHSFFRGTWNKVDAAVAVSQILELIVPGIGTELRGARTIRLLVRVPSVRVVCEILIKVLPQVIKVLLVNSIALIVFGVIGVTSFKGQLHHCNDPAINFKEDCVGVFNEVIGNLTNALHTEERARDWKNNRINFDNFAHSFFALIELATGEGWRGLMYKVIDATGTDSVPRVNAHPERAIFFVIFLMLGHFVLAGILLGTLVNSFFASHHHASKLLTVHQRNWMRLQQILSQYDLEWRAKVPLRTEWNGLKHLCYKINASNRFDVFIYVTILVNAGMLASSYFQMSDTHSRILHVANIIFIVIFIVEAFIRWAALGLQGYMRDAWYRFDLFCVVLSIVGLFLAVNTTVVRVARVIRGVRLLRKARRLKQLITTLQRCIPALLNVSLLLLYIFFNWGLVGVSMFKNVKPNPKLNRHESFKTLPEAMLIVYQVTTTETWTDGIEGTSLSPPDCEPENDNCGSYVKSVLYFSSALMVGAFIYLNLFLYVVLETYMATRREFKEAHGDAVFHGFEQFRSMWAEADPFLRRRITIDELIVILQNLPPPLWNPSKGRSPWLCLLENIRTIPVPITDEREVSYDDCMIALALKSVGIRRNDAASAVKGTLTKLQKFLDPTIFTLEHCVAARRISDLFRKWKSDNLKRTIHRMQYLMNGMKNQHSPKKTEESEENTNKKF